MRTPIFSLLLPAALAAPVLAQGAPPAPPAPRAVEISPVTREAGAAREALDDLRVLRGLNRLQLTPQQAAGLAQILDVWDQKRAIVDGTIDAKLTNAAAVLHEALPRVDVNPEERVPAEQTYHGIRQEQLAGQEQARRTARDQLIQFLKSLTPQQSQALLLAAREAQLQARLAALAGGGPGGFGRPGSALQELERLRTVRPEDYPRQRDMMAYRLGGGFTAMLQQRGQPGGRGRGGPGGPGRGGPGAAGGGAAGGGAAGAAVPPVPGGPGGGRRGFRGGPGGPGGFGGPAFGRGQLPQVTDPAVQTKVQQVLKLLDRVRAMPPVTWQSQRQGIAAQIDRDRETQRVQAAPTEQLIRAFVDEYLLQPRAGTAVRARFRLPEPAAPQAPGEGAAGG